VVRHTDLEVEELRIVPEAEGHHIDLDVEEHHIDLVERRAVPEAAVHHTDFGVARHTALEAAQEAHCSHVVGEERRIDLVEGHRTGLAVARRTGPVAAADRTRAAEGTRLAGTVDFALVVVDSDVVVVVRSLEVGLLEDVNKYPCQAPSSQRAVKVR
jgi:hypothetical protein